MSRVLLVAAVVLAGFASAEWVTVGAHYHTDFSDGTTTIASATEYMISGDNRYALLADHAEMINRTIGMSHQLRKECGADRWLATATAIPACIPGLECGLGPKNGTHLLYYGGRPSYLPAIVSIVEECGVSDPATALKKIGALASVGGAVLIAAHPTCPSYPFKILDADIDGIEVFDSFGKDAASDLYFLKKLKVARRKPMAIVTGSDYHGPNVSRLDAVGKYMAWTGNFSATLHAPWNLRHTYVDCYCKDTVVEAIKQRRSYASFGDARITSTSAWPGDTIEATEPIEISYDGVPFGPGVGNVIFAMGKGGTDFQKNAVTDHFAGTFRFDPMSLPAPVLKDGCYLYFLIGNVIATSAIEVLPYDKPVAPKKPSTFDKIASALVGGLVVGALQGADKFDLNIGPNGIQLTPAESLLNNLLGASASGDRGGGAKTRPGVLAPQLGGAGRNAGRPAFGSTPAGGGAGTAASGGYGTAAGGPQSPFLVAPVTGGGVQNREPAPTCSPCSVTGRGRNDEDGVTVEMSFQRFADTSGNISAVVTGSDGGSIRCSAKRPFGGISYTAAGFATGHGWKHDGDMGEIMTTEGAARVSSLLIKSRGEKDCSPVSGMVYYSIGKSRGQVVCKLQ